MINYYFLFCFVFSTMSIEIAENSEIDYGKNIGLAWPGQWFLGPATLATCKPACKPCTKRNIPSTKLI